MIVLIGQCKFYVLFFFLSFFFKHFLLDHNDLPVKPWDVEPQPHCSPTPVYKCNVSCHIAKAAWGDSPFTPSRSYTSIINSNLLTTLVYMMCGLVSRGGGAAVPLAPDNPPADVLVQSFSQCDGVSLENYVDVNGHLYWGWGIDRTECYTWLWPEYYFNFTLLMCT